MFESEEFRLLPPELQWTTVCPKQGESVSAFVAGKLALHTCHFINKASRPCRDLITKGRMVCYCAKGMNSRRQIGYLPMMTRDNEKIVMLMCATTAKKASLLAVGQPVKFWRPTKEKAPLAFSVLQPEELGVLKSQNMARMKPHDIRQYLLRILWQDHELCDYFDKTIPASEITDITPPPAPPARPPLAKKNKALQTSDPATDIVQGLSDALKVG